MSNFKNQAFKLKDLLKEKGHKVPLVSTQELLAKSYGFKNRHVAIEKEENFKNAFKALHSEKKEAISDYESLKVLIKFKNKPEISFTTVSKNSALFLTFDKIREQKIDQKDVKLIEFTYFSKQNDILKREKISRQEILDHIPRRITKDNIKNFDFCWSDAEESHPDGYNDLENFPLFEAPENGITKIRVLVEDYATFEYKDSNRGSKMDKREFSNWEADRLILKNLAYLLAMESYSEYESITENSIELKDFLEIPESKLEKVYDLLSQIQDLVYDEIDFDIKNVDVISNTSMYYFYDQETDSFILQENPEKQLKKTTIEVTDEEFEKIQSILKADDGPSKSLISKLKRAKDGDEEDFEF